jgi:hypothetical protein
VKLFDDVCRAPLPAEVMISSQQTKSRHFSCQEAVQNEYERLRVALKIEFLMQQLHNLIITNAISN